MYHQKLICNPALEKLINDLYEDLLLQIELDNWMKSLPAASIVSSEKSEIIALTLIKKAFVNRKLMRYRKVEETLKLALNYAKRNLTKIVSVHTLAEVYIETKYPICDVGTTRAPRTTCRSCCPSCRSWASNSTT